MTDLLFSPEAELAVVGGILLGDEDALSVVTEWLQPEDFYNYKNKYIMRAAYDLYEKGKPVDIVTVGQHLDDDQLLDTVGGSLYLRELLDRVVTVENIPHYSKIIRGLSDKRRIIAAGHEIEAVGANRDLDSDEAKEKAFDIISSAVLREVAGESLTHIGDLADRLLTMIDETRTGKRVGMTTGYPSFDKYIRDMKGKLLVIGGYTSMGKSVLMQNMAIRQAKKGIRTAIISLEMGHEEILQRMLQISGYLRVSEIYHGDMQAVVRAMKKLAVLPIWFINMRGSTISEIRRKMKSSIVTEGVESFYIDYLQKIRSDNSNKRWQQIGEITRELAEFARTNGTPIVTGSQVKRESAQEKSGPKLWHLRESGDIEQDADIILGIYRRVSPTSSSDIMDVEILKQRGGIAGPMINLSFIGAEQRLEEMMGDGAELQAAVELT